MVNVEIDVAGLSDVERAEEAKLKPITHLKEAVDLLLPQDRELFFRLYELVDDRFMSDGSHRQNGHMNIPSGMEDFVFRQFRKIVGSNDRKTVLEAVRNQWSVTVTDRYSKRKAKYNPLREARPVDKTKPNFLLQEIEEIINRLSKFVIGNGEPKTGFLYKIEKSTEDISLLWNSLLLIGLILFIIYGIGLHSRPIMIFTTIEASLTLSLLILKLTHSKR